jgi:hypothetical protein
MEIAEHRVAQLGDHGQLQGLASHWKGAKISAKRIRERGCNLRVQLRSSSLETGHDTVEVPGSSPVTPTESPAP